jgi:hypothetical protein
MAVDETYFERKRCCGGGVRAQRSRVCLQMRLLAGRRCCLAVDDATEGSFVGLVSLCPRFAGCRILCGTRSLDCRRRLRSLFRRGAGKRLPHNRQLTTPPCRHARPNRDLLKRFSVRARWKVRIASDLDRKPPDGISRSTICA